MTKRSFNSPRAEVVLPVEERAGRGDRRGGEERGADGGDDRDEEEEDAAVHGWCLKILFFFEVFSGVKSSRVWCLSFFHFFPFFPVLSERVSPK